MRSISSLWFVLALAVVSLAAVAPARAADSEEPVARAERLGAEGKVHYEQGEYAKAVAKYLEAYKLAPTAAALYNIAFVYDRKLSELDLAMDFYRRYIGDPDAEPRAVERATKRIAEIKALQAEQKKQERLQRRAARGGSTQQTAGWVTLGTGVALLGTGIAFGVLAQGTEDDFDASRQYDEKIDLRDRANTQALIADVLMGAGLVAATVGVVLVVTADSPDGHGDVRVGAAPMADGGLVTVGGAF